MRKYTYWPNSLEEKEINRIKLIKRSTIVGVPEYDWLKSRLDHKHWTFISMWGFALFDAWCATKSAAIILDLPRSIEQLTTEKECQPIKHIFIVKPFDEIALQEAIKKISSLPHVIYGKPIY